MIEYTVSIVTVCACGMVLLMAVTGTLQGVYDSDTETMDDGLAERLAHILDSYMASGNDTLILDGVRVLPEGCFMRVHDGFVELYRGEEMHIAMTDYPGEFELDCNDVVTIGRRTSRRSS